MEDCAVFDDTLFAILKECKTLPKFLDTVFGFLKRRTDFYCIATEPKAPVGLPAGWAEHFVKEAFFKWKPLDGPSETLQENVPEVACDVEVETSTVDTSAEEIENVEEDKQINNQNKTEPTTLSDFTSSDSYNGAAFNNYLWSQTITDIDVTVNVPENVTSKNITIVVLPQKITVALKDSNTVLLDGELCQKIKHNDAIWSLDKRKLEIHLEKLSEMWWNCLIQTEPKLDFSKIDCSRPFEELPEEAQAKIEELTWNQERKRLGLPTSDQITLEEKLKRNLNVNVSLFKGSFDPNTVIINP